MLSKLRTLAAVISCVSAITPSALAAEATSVHVDYTEFNLPDTLSIDGTKSISEKDFQKTYSKFPVAVHKDANMEKNDDGTLTFNSAHKNYYIAQRTKEYDGQITDDKESFDTGTTLKLDGYDGTIGLLTFDNRYQDNERPYDVLVSGNQTVQVPVIHDYNSEAMIALKPSASEYYVDGNTLYKIVVTK